MNLLTCLKSFCFFHLRILLVFKIHSAFIVTIPIFKQALSEAIFIKRKQLKDESINVLVKKEKYNVSRNVENGNRSINKSIKKSENIRNRENRHNYENTKGYGNSSDNGFDDLVKALF